MNLLERVLTLLRANLDVVIEKSDDPEKVLRQLQLDMRNQLVQVKTQVATAIAETHRLQKRSQEKQDEADKWLKKAEQSVQQGSDSNARTALAHHNDFKKQAHRYQEQKQDQERLVVTMRKILRQLEAKIEEVDTNIDLLLTRKRNAMLQQRIYDALKSNNPGDERTAQAQDAIMDEEARANALADLHQRDLSAQLEQLEQFATERQIEQQLQELKQKQQPPSGSLQSRDGEKEPHLGQAGTSSSTRKRRASANNLQMQAESSTSKDIDLAYLKKLLDLPQHND